MPNNIERYALNKNAEGYTDLTALEGIKRADKNKTSKQRVTEADEQKALMQWAKWQEGRYPELKLLYHCPNGGTRNKLEAANLKRQGVKAGVPDLFLPVPRSPKHGLFIEMKVGRNKCTDNQKKWIRNLLEQGYEVKVCYSCEEAIQVIKKYLNI
jgi:hypothetical protein